MQRSQPPDSQPGASARREYERRRAARERQTRQRHPPLGGLLLALRDAPQEEVSWARGAEGEREVARTLARLAPAVPVLHDRRMPGSRANIDHLAVTAAGIWVIDTKRYRGKITIAKPWFGPDRLMVAGRDRSTLVAALDEQVVAVANAIDVPVLGALCFVDGELSLLGPRTIREHLVTGPRRLAKRLARSGPAAGPVAEILAQRFPPA